MRKIWMDIHDGLVPRRGDVLQSPKSTYYVLHSRRIKRRVQTAVPRFQLFVLREDEFDDEVLLAALGRTAKRRGGYQLIKFTWNSRNKKSKGLRFDSWL